MGAAAAGVFLNLDARLHHETTFAQRGRSLLGIVPAATGEGPHETEATFQGIVGCGETCLHQPGGVDPGAACGSGMVGLGHSAEVLPQAGSLGRGKRDGHGGLIG